MNALQKLLVARAALVLALQNAANAGEKDNRSLTAAENDTYDKAKKALTDHDELIKRAREMEAHNRTQAEIEAELRSPTSRPAGQPLDQALRENRAVTSDYTAQEMHDLQHRYRLSNVIRAAMDRTGRTQLTGLEAEWAQEEEKRNRAAGLSYRSGSLIVPAALFMLSLRAAATAGGSGTGAELVPTFHDPAIVAGSPPPAFILRELGATFLEGLTGNVTFTRETNSTEAVEKAEGASATEIALATALVTLAPKRLPVYTDLSTTLLLQGGPTTEAYVRGMLLGKLWARIQKSAIQGSGSGAIPTGILNTSGIGAVALGTNGAAPTWASIVGLETEIETDEALMGRLAYLTTVSGKGKLKTTNRTSGQDSFIWKDDNTLNGYLARSSGSVPNDLTKGSASGVCSAAIFGDWSSLLIGLFGGVEIIPDNLTQALAGNVRIHAATHFDVALRRPQAFAAIKDMLTA